MQKPDPGTAVILITIAFALFTTTLPLPFLASAFRWPWWIPLTVNLTGVFMLVKTAFWPSEPGVPAVLGWASAIWLVFYFVIVTKDISADDEDEPARETLTAESHERID